MEQTHFRRRVLQSHGRKTGKEDEICQEVTAQVRREQDPGKVVVVVQAVGEEVKGARVEEEWVRAGNAYVLNVERRHLILPACHVPARSVPSVARLW